MLMDSRNWQFTLGEKNCTVRVPADPENQYQQAWDRYQQREDYFPFWLEVWKSSVILFGYLHQQGPVSKKKILEIGGGSGVLAQLLEQFPEMIPEHSLCIHSDLIPDACVYAASQVKRPWVAMDIGAGCFQSGFDLILGSDLFYEDRLVHRVLNAVPQLLNPDGMMIICDPHRKHRLKKTQEILHQSALKIHSQPFQMTLDHVIHTVDIHCICL